MLCFRILVTGSTIAIAAVILAALRTSFVGERVDAIDRRFAVSR